MTLFLLTPLLHSCSDNLASINEDEIIVFILDNRIDVKNHFSQPIYYFAVESGSAAVLHWAPASTDENEIVEIRVSHYQQIGYGFIGPRILYVVQIEEGIGGEKWSSAFGITDF